MVMREHSLLMLAFQEANGFGIRLGLGGIVKALKLRTAPVQIHGRWRAAKLSQLVRKAARPGLILWLPVMGLPALVGPGLGASGAAQTNRCC